MCHVPRKYSLAGLTRNLKHQNDPTGNIIDANKNRKPQTNTDIQKVFAERKKQTFIGARVNNFQACCRSVCYIYGWSCQFNLSQWARETDGQAVVRKVLNSMVKNTDWTPPRDRFSAAVSLNPASQSPESSSLFERLHNSLAMSMLAPVGSSRAFCQRFPLRTVSEACQCK